MSSLFGGSHGYIPSLASFTDGASLVRGPHELGQKVSEREKEGEREKEREPGSRAAGPR